MPARPRPATSVIPVEELTSIRDRSPNVLVVGTDTVTAAATAEIRAFLRLPITTVCVTPDQTLPLAIENGTLVVRGVHALSVTEQQRLYEWMSRSSGATQVIATSPVSLLPLVERGAFLDLLYYRLNTICLELAAS